MKLVEKAVIPGADARLELDLGGKPVVVSRATADDVLGIRWLYHRVYGGSYPFTLVYDPRECAKAIESDRYLWFLARAGDQVVGSLIFSLDRGARLGKAFGGVVAEEYRGRDLAEKMLNFGLGVVAGADGAARSVYATTRTVNLAPQRLVEKAGFKKLGVFPNVHKVQRSETHTLAVFYGPDAIAARATKPRLPALLKPFFSVVRRETGLPDAEYAEMPPASVDGAPVAFEYVAAPQFVLRRWAGVKSDGKLMLDFFPFHEPNMFLISADGKSELYVYRSAKDGHCVLTGARSEGLALGRLLDQGAQYLEGMGVRYFEILVEAGDAEAVNQALGARFLPSGYYPAMRWDADGRNGRDYVVMSRSMAVLDFKGVELQPAYRDYLNEYFRLWRDLYVGRALP